MLVGRYGGSADAPQANDSSSSSPTCSGPRISPEMPSIFRKYAGAMVASVAWSGSDLLVRLQVPAGLDRRGQRPVRLLFLVLDLDLGEVEGDLVGGIHVLGPPCLV
jgi:hypothetical protein